MMGGSIVRAILSSQPGVLPHRSPAASCLKAIPTVLVPCLPGSRRGNHRKRCLPLGVGRRSLGAAGCKASVLGQCDGRLLQPGELVQPLDCQVRVNHSDGTECRKRDMATRAGGDVPPGSTSVVSSPVAAKVKCVVPKLSFCPTCGGPIEQQIPEGEHELRDVCTICGAVHYQNPKMVVGCLVEHEDKVLLCRRAIKPSYGLWTFPSGFMELGESAAEGAARETWEEAHAQVEVLSLFAHLDIPLLGQSCIIFRAKLKQPDFSPGPESLECALFGLNDIPFEDLAFSSIHVVLKLYKDDIAAGSFHVHHGVIDKRPGADPSDLVAVRDHLVM